MPIRALHPVSVTSRRATVKISCSPAEPWVSRQSRSAVCGPAATLVVTSSSSSAVSRCAFDASTNPANVAPRAMRTISVVRLTGVMLAHGSRGHAEWRR